MQLKSFERNSGAIRIRPSRVDPARPQVLFGFDLTKFNDSQAKQVFVLLDSHLNECSICKAKGGLIGVFKESEGASSLAGNLFTHAALFKEEHSYHSSWVEVEKFKRIFEAVVNSNSLEKLLQFNDSSSVLHENASRSSSSSCFSYKACPNLTYQTLVSRSQTETFPFPSSSQNKLPIISSPSVPIVDVAVTQEESSAQTQNLKHKTTLKSLFRKLSKKTKKASNQERKRDKLRRFLRNPFDVFRHKDIANEIDIITTQLIKRDNRLSLDKYRLSIVNGFFRSLLVASFARGSAGVLKLALELRPETVKISALGEVTDSPKQICWYEPEDSDLATKAVENVLQLLQSQVFFDIEIPLASCSFFEARIPNLVAVKISQKVAQGMKYFMPLPLTFYLVLNSLQLKTIDLIEGLKHSFESKLLLNEYHFQNYTTCRAIAPVTDKFGVDALQLVFTAPAAEITDLPAEVADDDYSSIVAYLKSKIETNQQWIEELAFDDEPLDETSSIASTFVEDSRVELMAAFHFWEKTCNIGHLPYEVETMVDEDIVELFEFPGDATQRRSEVDAVVASSVSFAEISDKALTYFSRKGISPFQLGDNNLEILEVIKDYEYPPVGICNNNTEETCEVQGHYHIMRCMHETPCNMHEPFSLAKVFHRMVTADSVLYKFGTFVNMAYPRLGFTVLELVDYEVIQCAMEQRSFFINEFQSSCVQWLLRHRLHKLYLRQAMKFVDLLNPTKHKQALRRIRACSPEDADLIEGLHARQQGAAIERFIVDSGMRYQVMLKKCEAREFMMHQAYMGTMALLLDPMYQVPVNFKSLFIDTLDEQIEQSFRSLSLSSWVELSTTTESIDIASITFMLLNGVVDAHYEHDEMFRQFTNELQEIK